MFFLFRCQNKVESELWAKTEPLIYLVLTKLASSPNTGVVVCNSKYLQVAVLLFSMKSNATEVNCNK